MARRLFHGALKTRAVRHEHEDPIISVYRIVTNATKLFRDKVLTIDTMTRDREHNLVIPCVRAPMRVVLDTNVLVAAVRSRQGASFALVSSIPSLDFQPCLSVALYSEWQEVLMRPVNLPLGKTPDDAQAFVRYLASQSLLQEIHFLWRPFLPDADDDMVLELAFAANCQFIVTHNIKDFSGSEKLGVTALTPREFLKLIRKK